VTGVLVTDTGEVFDYVVYGTKGDHHILSVEGQIEETQRVTNVYKFATDPELNRVNVMV
jgi:hypothetical protein